MMKFPISEFENIETPCYYYDLNLLRNTLNEVKKQISGYPYNVHYAVKANANPVILDEIKNAGLGVDCVSGWEVKAAIEAGISADKVVFAGVGKTDKEINWALDYDIHCFNVESKPELQVINELAQGKNTVANVAIRINPNIDAHTHEYITTGLNENKFGINLDMIEEVVNYAKSLSNINLLGLHFHIGSQILDMEPYIHLCAKINELQDKFENLGIVLKTINVGGGLGIDYENPDENPMPDFESYFNVFKTYLKLRDGQELHFELGRSLVAQCGSLITRVVYVKEGSEKKFLIVDAGMNDLIRPALYQAHHKIENISSDSEGVERYDVVGPICESSDCFGKDEMLQVSKRGDLIAMRSAGAYGQIMASQYNCRPFAQSIAK